MAIIRYKSGLFGVSKGRYVSEPCGRQPHRARHVPVRYTPKPSPEHSALQRAPEMVPQDHADQGGVTDAQLGRPPPELLHVLRRQPQRDLLQLPPLYLHVRDLFRGDFAEIRAVEVVGQLLDSLLRNLTTAGSGALTHTCSSSRSWSCPWPSVASLPPARYTAAPPSDSARQACGRSARTPSPPGLSPQDETSPISG